MRIVSNELSGDKLQGRGKAEGKTWSNIPVKEIYTQGDLDGWDAERDLGVPGQYPYTRGIHTRMYRDRLWLRRQLTGFASASEVKERQEFLSKVGHTG